jgi:Domain of unknown function (DUF6434)/SAP domain-containing new25
MRPDISTFQTGEDFKKWYWLKEEVVAYCKGAGIPYSGSKFEIIDRIAEALDKGLEAPKKAKKADITSKMEWHKADLTLETVITDSYKNGQNVRIFFIEYCGQNFSFNIEFMAWMKANVGKTLKDAVEEWLRITAKSKDKTFKKVIPEGNQYNQYMRDFFADNPDKTIKEARHFWQLKRSLPLGLHKYERSDLDLT